MSNCRERITRWSPVTSGLQLWYEAGSEPYADGAAVSHWTDKSPFGRDLTSFDANSTATYRANAVNGLPAIEFNGSTSLLKTYGSTFTIAQPDTIFLVYRSLDTDTNARAFVVDSRDSNARQVVGRQVHFVRDCRQQVGIHQVRATADIHHEGALRQHGE